MTIKDLIVADKNNYQGVKIQSIYYKDLIENKKNTIFKQDEIESLAKNIEEIGLLEPLVVQPTDNGYYLIISGHRRYNAHKFLVEQEGKEKYEDIACRVLNFADEDESVVALFASNAQRQYEVSDKVKIVKAAEALYLDLVKTNKRPDGRKRDWIANLTGFSGRAVQDYLGEGKLQAEAQQSGEEQGKDKSLSKTFNLDKEIKKILFKMDKLEELFDEQGLDSTLVFQSKQLLMKLKLLLDQDDKE